MPQISSSYDEVAQMYHTLWADWYLPAAMPGLERLFFSQVPAGARVLDLCCGCGHVTKELVKRGYNVTGVDLSAELIALARKELPQVDFRVQDVKELQLETHYDAALSTFDSLNHILIFKDLEQVFVRVHAVLKRDALFVFDMNLEHAYSLDSQEWSVDVTELGIGLVRGTYDVVTKMAKTELIWFVPSGSNDLWKQRRSVVKQRCYPQDEILRAVREAGFRTVRVVAAREAGVTSSLGFGRMFFVACA